MGFEYRKNQSHLAELEAQGISLWTGSIGPIARIRMLSTLEFVCDKDSRLSFEISDYTAGKLRMFEGRIYNLRHWSHVGELAAQAPDGLFLSIVEYAVEAAIMRVPGDRDLHHDWINRVLLEERLAYELVEGSFVEIASQELHAEVVEPTLRLLSGRDGWANVEACYRKALEEIGTDPADAITDAGTALQETLTRLGASGNALGPLLKSAHKMGLLGPSDARMSKFVEQVGDWVSADRSTKGDSHNADEAQPEDAWFAVHVVGALILRLVSGPPRGDA